MRKKRRVRIEGRGVRQWEKRERDRVRRDGEIEEERGTVKGERRQGDERD